ncbi:DNA primase [Candidatus Profftia lariciata]|uniref:DNA primase n=1 Tax=Candidatus Profftia lariciata TaxID=1987921 RepID=UPI001D020437|nr:DNA primase [Candidatus Profftia lariciata]UDG81572.1 DNA primase [Candidatus Profftia lariciata]
MVGRISRLFIQDLLHNINIVDLINTRIQLKKKGNNYHACCPFHNEKNPSFIVNQDKQFYYCFGCGAHGNAIDFLMKYEMLDFIKSIEELANITGLKIPFEAGIESHKTTIHKRQLIYKLMNDLSEFYTQALYQSNNKYAHQYLVKRGLNQEIIERFSIGYAPPGWDNILKKFGLNLNIRKALDAAGMLINNDQGQIYDRFRDRLIFPIRDKSGRIIAFGGRSLNKNIIPKYINSPDTDIFHKGRHLFGLYEAYKHCSIFNSILVVEGYMDVITLAQYGITYALASLGTATTLEHIQLMFRMTDTIICCYDGDNAGRKAAWRTLNKALPFLYDGKQLKFMFLPNDEDPDTLIRKEGSTIFQQRIEKSQSLSSFLFDMLIPQVDLSTPDGRTKLSALSLPLIEQIPGMTLRLYLRQFLGQKIGILDDQKLDKLLPKQINEKKKYHNFQIKRTNMRMLIGLLVQNPFLASEVNTLNSFKEYKLPGLALFIEIVETCLAQPGLTTGQLLELYRDNKYIKQLENLATWNHMIIKEMVHKTFLDTLSSIYDSMLEQRQEKLIALDRIKGLSANQRQELWILNQTLAKK